MLKAMPMRRWTGVQAKREKIASASIVAAPIRQVVDEIGRLSGTAVDGIAALDDEPVSTSFVDLPLTDALERVLGARSFALVVSGSRPSRIVILPGGGGSAAPAVQRPTTVARPHLAVAPDEASAAEGERAVRLQAVHQLAEIADDDPDARIILA